MINQLAEKIHNNAIIKGFAVAGESRNFGELIALIHSEVSEALEGDREGILEPTEGEKIMIVKDLNVGNTESYSKFKKSPGFELADALIRILDTAADKGITDLEWYITTKMKFNESRPPKHGKKY